MKVLKAEINWYEGYANDPNFIMHVDSMPDNDEFIFEAKELTPERTLYFAEHESGLVRFYCHDTRNESGYGGSSVTLNMKDGSTKTIKGPWSSRSGAMNNHFRHSVECSIRPEDTGYNLGGHITVELAEKLAEMTNVILARQSRHGDLVYQIVGEWP